MCLLLVLDFSSSACSCIVMSMDEIGRSRRSWWWWWPSSPSWSMNSMSSLVSFLVMVRDWWWWWWWSVGVSDVTSMEQREIEKERREVRSFQHRGWKKTQPFLFDVWSLKRISFQVFLLLFFWLCQHHWEPSVMSMCEAVFDQTLTCVKFHFGLLVVWA